MDMAERKVSGLQVGIIVLTLATAAIHFALGVVFPDPMFTPLFILNALIYLALMVVYLLPQLAAYHNLIRWVFIAFTAVTVVAYFVFNSGNFMNPIGLLTKVIEIALIVLLWLDRRNP
jgi:phosphoglycerol transferase MdoB-like AlkP superfamily enzyme